MILYRYANSLASCNWLLTILHVRGSEYSTTPMPGIGWEKYPPLTTLVPVKSEAGPSKDKSKSKEQLEMEEGKVKRERSLS
jgi:hypothetical protein